MLRPLATLCLAAAVVVSAPALADDIKAGSITNSPPMISYA